MRDIIGGLIGMTGYVLMVVGEVYTAHLSYVWLTRDVGSFVIWLAFVLPLSLLVGAVPGLVVALIGLRIAEGESRPASA